jgi:hypothetical protein
MSQRWVPSSRSLFRLSKAMPCFSIRTLLVATTLVALFLGFAQWRRTRLLSEIAALRAEGVEVEVRNEWIDKLWPRAGKYAFILIVDVSPTQRRLGTDVYHYLKGEGSEHYRLLEDRCYALGVEYVGNTLTTEDNLDQFMHRD